MVGTYRTGEAVAISAEFSQDLPSIGNPLVCIIYMNSLKMESLVC